MLGLGLVLGLFSALPGPARTRSPMFDRLQRRNNSHGLSFYPRFIPGLYYRLVFVSVCLSKVSNALKQLKGSSCFGVESKRSCTDQSADFHYNKCRCFTETSFSPNAWSIPHSPDLHLSPLHHCPSFPVPQSAHIHSSPHTPLHIPVAALTVLLNFSSNSCVYILASFCGLRLQTNAAVFCLL